MGTPELELAPATRQHLLELAPRMRAADLAEVLAAGCSSALDALESSLALSDIAYAVRIDGEVAAVFGVAPERATGLLAPPISGLVWLLTSDTVTRYPMTFFRLSKPLLAMLLEYCPVLINSVDARYTSSLRWLKYLGAAIGPPVPLGTSGELFCCVSFGRP